VAKVSERIRVLVVDDDALVRAGLSMLLAGAEDIGIVGEATDGSEVAQAVAEHEPDVVLMDIRMPGMDGLAATELLRAQDELDLQRAGRERVKACSETDNAPESPLHSRNRVPTWSIYGAKRSIGGHGHELRLED
jgi:CheY-like chemotaxis protein